MWSSLTLLSFTLAAQAPAGWSLSRSGDGVEVFSRSEPGYGLKAYRAVMKIPASLDSAVALIADVETLSQWYEACSENKLLKRISPKEMFTYFVNDSPFPVMDRDNVIHTVVTMDPATRVVRFHMVAVPDFIPEHSDRVRIRKFEGDWILTPLPDGQLEVVHEVRSDPGGNVPSFLANMTVTVGPQKTLTRMKKMLQKPRYKDAKIDVETAAVTFGK